MIINKIERIFLADPNLLKNFGHVIETVSAIKDYLTSNKTTQLFVISNVVAESSLSRVAGVFYPALTNTCFDMLENKGEIFCEDLKELHWRFKFTHKDLIVIPTCFTNEIHGASKFLSRTGLSVRIVLMFHQCIVPAEEFSDTFTRGYQTKCKLLLAEALEGVNKHASLISVWTTESQELSGLINSISMFKVGKLPLPINFHPLLLDKPRCNGDTTIAFLGDGRYEKGLFLFMEAIRKLDCDKLKFVAQDIEARGYSFRQYRAFSKLKLLLLLSNKVRFINTPMDPYKFQKEVSKTDILVFPYHPLSYDRRVSEVYIQSIMYQKVAVVSKGTWLGQEAKKFCSGLIFDYDCKDLKQTADNIKNAILIAVKNKDCFAREIMKQAKIYRKFNTPEHFFKIIFEYYNLE